MPQLAPTPPVASPSTDADRLAGEREDAGGRAMGQATPTYRDDVAAARSGEMTPRANGTVATSASIRR